MSTDLSTLPYDSFPIFEDITYDGGTYQQYGARMTEACKVAEDVILVVSRYQASGVGTGRIARAVRWTGGEPEMGPVFIWSVPDNYSMTVHQMQQLTDGVAVEVFVDGCVPNSTPDSARIPLGNVWRVDDGLNITREFLFWDTPPDPGYLRRVSRVVSCRSEGRVSILTLISESGRYQTTMHTVTMSGDAVVVNNQIMFTTTNASGQYATYYAWTPVNGASALYDTGDGFLHRFGYPASGSDLVWTKFNFANGVVGAEVATRVVATGIYGGELYVTSVNGEFHLLIPQYGTPAVSNLLVVSLDGVEQARATFATYYQAFYDYTDEWMGIVPLSATESFAAQLGTGAVPAGAPTWFTDPGDQAGVIWTGEVSDLVPVQSWTFDSYNDVAESFKPVAVGDGKLFTFFAGRHDPIQQQVWLTQLGIPPDIDGGPIDDRRRFVR